MCKNILLIEDDPTAVELFLAASRAHHAAGTVLTISDGEEALDYLFSTGPRASSPPEPLPKVILLDLNLGTMDGVEVLRRIRSVPRTRLLPVVALTTSSEHPDLLRAYELGVNSFVLKPVDFETFIKHVNILLHYWLSVNLPPPDLT